MVDVMDVKGKRLEALLVKNGAACIVPLLNDEERKEAEALIIDAPVSDKDCVTCPSTTPEKAIYHLQICSRCAYYCLVTSK